MDENIILRFDNVSKFFPGVVANDKVNLTIRKGEIHSLLGENGAGKSTLMNVLYGLYKADEGTIYYEGKPVDISSPNDAIAHGIGMIHQHFMLIPTFTIWENVVLGQKMEKGIRIPKAQLIKKVQEVAESLHMKMDVTQKVGTLAVGMQQKVEILKAMYRGSRLLILDEPTAVLTPQESDELMAMMRQLKSEGCTIIFITHKLHEVMQVSDRVSVLRDGVLIETRDVEGCTATSLSSMMVGREVTLKVDKKPSNPGAVKLKVENLSKKTNSPATSLKHVSFEVRAGEVVGIAGVDGNGQNTLASVVSGLLTADEGKVYLDGEDMAGKNVRARTEKGLSYVPADRRNTALTLPFRLFENTVLNQYYKKPFASGGLIKQRVMRQTCKEHIEAYNIKAPGTEIFAANLSGGNQQKVVLAREISKQPDVLMICQPTWGLDIGACDFVHNKILEERDRGGAVLLVSTDLEEVRSMSDRLLVMYEGEIMGEVDPATTKVEDIGLMMAGSKIEAQN